MTATAPNPSVAMARAFIDEFARNGIRAVVLAPGSRSGALAMAAAQAGVALHVAVDERSAGFWGLGYAKLAKRPVVVLTTSGTALANVMPAVVEADRSGTPLVVLSADRPSEFRQSGANQTIDQIKLFGERVRFFADVPAASDFPGEAAAWRSLVCQATDAARSGPVHLNLAFREPLVPATDDGRAVARPYTGDLAGRGNGGPWTRAAARPQADLRLGVSGRTLVAAGPGADHGLVEKAVAAGLVVIAEGHSGCRVPGTISTAHHLLSGEAAATALRPQRAVMLGAAGLSRALLGLLAGVETTVVGANWLDPARQATEITEIGGWDVDAPDQSWATAWFEADAVARKALDQLLDGWEEISEPRTARDVVATVPEGGVLAVASSMPARDVDWFAAPRTGLRLVANRGASGIDGFISLAAGAAGAVKDTPVVGLVGDLSFLHDANGLLTKPTPNLVLVLVNNDGGGIFSFLPQADYPEHFERIFGTPTGVDFGGLTRALGGSHLLIEHPDDLSKAIHDSLALEGIGVVEVRTDRARNVSLHREATATVKSAVESLFEG